MNRNFANTIEKIRGNCGRVLLAVSGGVDSMCMAELFAEAGMQFGVAHCNFRLRGDESDGDEALVRRWATSHNIEFHLKHFDTEEYARDNGISIEMAARDLRYQWFAELCEEYGYDAVAVAHNANDNAETLMLNLLRGAGMNGLCGMSLFSRIPVQGAEETLLLRPLLQFTRKQIEGYMFARRLPYRNDSTNDSSEYKRNRLRNEVFPIFESINPSFIRTFNREMSNFAEAGEIVSDYCRALVPSLVSQPGDGTVRIDMEALKAQKHWRYILYFILEPYGFNSATLGSIEDLLDSSRTASGKSFASAAYSLNIERKEMILSPLKPDTSSKTNQETDSAADSKEHESADFSTAATHNDPGIMPVRTAGTYHFNGRTIKVEVLQWTADMPLKQPEGTLIMDADKLRFPFVLRAWRSGDWLIPLGMKGRKKLSDLFTDLKYDSLQKKSAVVVIDTTTADLAEAQHVAALVSERIDNRYKVCDCTRSVIRISENKN